MSQDALNRLHTFVSKADTVNVLMVADARDRADGEIAFDVQRVDMSQRLAQSFREIVSENTTDGLETNVLVEYTTGRKLDRHELFYIKLDNNSDTAKTLAFVESVTKPGVFVEEEDFARRMAFYTVVFEDTDGTRAAFYRKHAPKRQLSRGLLTRIVADNQFDKIESRTYLFDEKVDFFTYDGCLFIRGAYNFRLIFKHFEKLQQEVSSNVKEIMNAVPIANASDFLDACQNQPQMVSKVARIADQPYLKNITIEDIKKTIEEFDLEVQITKDSGKEKLVFEKETSKRWLILKLLDDDYLGSVLTNRKYETNSKSVRSGE